MHGGFGRRAHARVAVLVAIAMVGSLLVALPLATWSPPAADAAPGDPPSITLDGTGRDFRMGHPIDFECPCGGSEQGIVRPDLGADGKPVYAVDPPGRTGTTSGRDNFDTWFNDVPDLNMRVPISLQLDAVPDTSPQVYRYGNGSFFPLTDKGFGNEGYGVNFSFTFELHTQFTYQGGERFSFTGDDDVWVYINGKLAIDLGGIHPAAGASVDLDTFAATAGMTTGQDYRLDLFFAERHTSASSFAMDTTLQLRNTPPPAVTGDAGPDQSVPEGSTVLLDASHSSSPANATRAVFDGTSGSTPDAACPPWQREGSAGSTVDGVFQISTGGEGDLSWYSQVGDELAIPDVWTIDARVRVVDDGASDPTRTGTAVLFSTEPTVGTGLMIGNGKAWLMSGNQQIGASVDVDTTAREHDYRIEVRKADRSVKVLYDATQILAGAEFASESFNGSLPRVGFGDGSQFAHGVSRWFAVGHNGLRPTPACKAPLSYQWQLISAQGPPIQLSSTTDPRPSFAAFDDGTYTFRVTVTDGATSASDEVVVRVTNQNPVVSRVDAGPTATDGLAQVAVTFTDPGPFDTHKVRFDWGDGAPVSEVAAAVDGSGWGYGFAGHVYPSTGDKTVTVTVVDDDGGISATATKTFNVGAAGQGEAAPGAALWASSQTASDAIRISGSGNNVSGLTHSNNDIRISGSSHRFLGGTEYRSSISVSGSGTTFDPAARQVPATPAPYEFNIADYRPGGRAAVAAGSRYTAIAASACKGGKWKPTKPLTTGLVFVPCGVQISGSEVAGQVTVVATGDIQVSGSAASFTPFIDGLLFFSTSTGTKAIDLSGSGHVFHGALYASAGGIELTGSGSTLDCGIVAQTARISGSNNAVTGTNCGSVGSGSTPVPIAASPVVVPNLVNELGVDKATVRPGESVTYQATVRNGITSADPNSPGGGATVFLPVQLGADNRGSTPVTVTGVTYLLEVHDPTTGSWTPLASTAATAPVGQRIATLTAQPNPTTGVTYPTTGDLVAGTTVAPRAIASWAGLVRIALAPDQVDTLMDPTKVDAIRNTVDLATSGPFVRKLTRFAADPVADLRTAPKADVADIALNLTRMGSGPQTFDAATTPGLARLTPGRWASVVASSTASSPVPKGAGETDAAYLARLAQLDGTALYGAVHSTGHAGVGTVYGPQQLARSNVVLPVVAATLAGPATLDAGAVARWTIALTNTGSDTATGLDVHLNVAGVGDLVLDGVPATLAPGQSATVTATRGTDVGVTTTLNATAAVRWTTAGGPAGRYGPVGNAVATQVRPAVALRATKVATSSGGNVPAGQIEYTVAFRNEGNQPLTGIALTDPIDLNSRIVAGSLVTSTGTITSGTQAGDTTVGVILAMLAPGDGVSLVFRVDHTAASGGVTQIVNQASVSSNELPPVLTDDPRVPGATDPTVTPINGAGGPGGGGGSGVPGPSLGSCTPGDTAMVTTPGPVSCTLIPSGTATVKDWRMTAQPLGAPDSEQRFLAAGSGAAASGSFDPTMLANGQWTIRIDAIGSDGGFSRLETTVVVDGQLKLGRNRITYTDLTVPVAGIPIQVQRTYDTLDRLKFGDFGYGWTVGVANYRVQANRILGAGAWEQYQCGVAVVVATFCFRSTGAQHAVTVTWPEGRTETFDMVPGTTPPGFSFLTPIGYKGRPGTTSKLEPAPDDQFAMWTGDGNLYRPLEAEYYQPTRFTLVARDGTRYLLDTGTGLVEARDRNANTVTVSRDGVVSSTGVKVSFDRDTTDGHIKAVTGPDGRSITYGYVAGELQAVTDQNAHVTGYTYKPGHLLDQLDDPGPGVASRQEYDADGRLIAITDGTGLRTTVSVDPNARTQVVTSPDQRSTTRSTMDERGNVLSEDVVFADPAGDHHVTTWTYSTDGRDAITSRTDPNLSVWSAEYDTAGNLRRFVDADNRALTVDYDDYGAPTKTTDAAGLVTTYTYDPATGNLTDIHELGVGGGDRHTRMTYDGAGRVRHKDGNALRAMDYTYTSQGWLETETDALNHVTQYTYDDLGRLKTAKDANNDVTSYEYDDVGNLTKQTSPELRTRVYQYDAADRLWTSKDEDGFVTTNRYDDAGRLESVEDALQHVTTYGYDGNGRRTSVRDPNGHETLTGYDGGGRPNTVTDPRGKVTTRTYDKGGRVVAVIAPDRGTTTTSYYPGGQVQLVVDGAGQRTSYEYDAVGRTKKETVGTARTTTYGYDGFGRPSTVTDANGSTTRTRYLDSGEVSDITSGITTTLAGGTGTVTYGYDLAGRRTTVRDGSRKDDNTPRETITEYDPAGRVASTKDAAGQATTYGYDHDGRLKTVTEPSGIVTTYGYDNRGHQTSVTDALNHRTQAQWDGAGRQDWTEDALHRRTTFGYDAGGQLRTTTDAKGGRVRYDYDEAGRRTKVTDANGAERVYGYNDAGDPTSVKLPPTTAVPTGPTSTTAFDLAGRVAGTTDARGLTTGYTYLPNGDLDHVVRQEPGGGSTTIRYGYDAAGQRTSMTDPTGTTTWTLDSAGRTKSVASPQGTIGYDYDPAGRRTSMSLPAVAGAPGGQINYGYDAAGRVRTVANGTSPGGPTTTTYSYFLDGRVNQISRSNGVTTTHSYDPAGRLTGLTHASGSGEKAGYVYTLDDNGNRVAQRHRVNGGAETVETYMLDELSRLTDVTYSDTGQADHYDYDAAGNRTKLVRTGGADPGTTNYHYDGAQQLTSTEGTAGTVSYGYDANGNLVSSSAGETYGYDGANQLTSATVGSQAHSYRFDGDGTRVTADGHVQLYDTADGLPTLVNDGVGTTTIHDPGSTGVLANSTSTGTSYPLADGLGSVRAVTDSSGAVTATADYDAYGSVRNHTGAAGTFGFTGEQTDATALVNLRARSYQPRTGRFLQADSLQPNADGTQGWSLYGYVGANPTTATDPSGRIAVAEDAIKLSAEDQAYLAFLERQFLSEAITRTVLRVAVALLLGSGACAVTICAQGDGGSGDPPGPRVSPPTVPDPKTGPPTNPSSPPLPPIPPGQTSSGSCDAASPDTGPYSKVKGHHVLQKAAFDPSIWGSMYSVSYDFMDDCGISHQDVTRAQRSLQDELSQSGRTNTLQEQARIAEQALIDGGADPALAHELVEQAVRVQQGLPFPDPIKTPWN